MPARAPIYLSGRLPLRRLSIVQYFHKNQDADIMRIALIHNLYPPDARGGAERIVVAVAQELMRQGHDVIVVTTLPTWRRSRRKVLVPRPPPAHLKTTHYQIPSM